jgi:ferrochelatase
MTIGILLTNTGTPDAATPKAVYRYLREFLADKRVVHLPRWLWLPILYMLVLPIRAKRSAKLYEKIWQPQGSPMRIIMQKIQDALAQQHKDHAIALGMNYGHPSIAEGLAQLQQQGAKKIIILPLFPQYSNTTTASTFDRVTHALSQWSALPELVILRDYATQPLYIQALAASIQQVWATQGKQHLLISFHGIPQRFVTAGDPYAQRCEQTAHLLADALALTPEQWTLCYQSKFGYDKWLQPAIHKVLTVLPKQNIKQVDVVCPGFAVDCLETLEEIALRGKETFIQAGGEKLRYLPALNDNAMHIALLTALSIF